MFHTDSHYIAQIAHEGIGPTRLSIIDKFVEPTALLVTDESRIALIPDGSDQSLYVGTHDCVECVDDYSYVDLWLSSDGLSSDDPEEDFFGWYLADTSDDMGVPINFCPFCGINLMSTLKMRLADD